MLFIVAVIISPVSETFFLQLIPVVLARRLGYGEFYQFLSASVPFALIHFVSGLSVGVSAGVVFGIIFGLAFIVCSKDSYGRATAVTIAIHSIHNIFFFLCILHE
jgi:hypothetical protein